VVFVGGVCRWCNGLVVVGRAAVTHSEIANLSRTN